jgi:hypothetical protein
MESFAGGGLAPVPDGRCLFAVAFLVYSLPALCAAQDLTPRAYLVTPVSSNAITLTYAFSNGDITFDPTLPIADASGTLHTPVLSYYHAFDFFGRSANVSGSLAWVSGSFRASVAGADRTVHREGLMDSTFRAAVNLMGGTALPVSEFVKTRPSKNVIGASLRIVAPTGQYVNTRAINPGAHRWGFKPEVGFSHRARRLIVDAYSGVWLFTANDDYFAANEDSVGSVRKQSPIGSFEGHVSYDVNPRLWISLDINYWYGGRTTVNGERNLTSLQSNSRIGVTGAIPVSRHQSLKCSFSDGVITRVGGRFKVLSMAWQYSWVGLSFRRTQ